MARDKARGEILSGELLVIEESSVLDSDREGSRTGITPVWLALQVA
jgi:hypothetical protein